MKGSIINVDAEGFDAEGNGYDDVAYPDKVAAGYAINRPVLLRYPDGKLREGNEVRFTEAGIRALRLEMAEPAGRA